MKHVKYLVLGLFILCAPQIHTETYKTESRVEPSKITIRKRNALVKEIELVFIDFFENVNCKAFDDFRCDEATVIKNLDGTPEEIEVAFAKMYLTHARAKSEMISLHYTLEQLESRLMATGLSRLEAYLVSIDTMDRISIDHRDPEKLQILQKKIRKVDPSLWEQEIQYALSILQQIENQEYESEGHRIILAMNVRNILERTYIRKKYEVQ